MHKTRIDLAVELRGALVELLNQSLADLIDLHLQAKQAHWNVKGPGFIALHKLFDELADDVHQHIDEVAERITALGGIADGTLASVARQTTLPPYPCEIADGSAHLDALASAVAVVGKATRTAIGKAEQLEDADTADLLTGMSRALDKQLWFLESHLQGN